ncbi:hypothetical protein MACH07_27300 [Flagellimonas marinaquae]|uniref:Fibronectin type-III domain-containing protein n=1 Tax=Flagellimonas marinaquae TaxID=254955 RepID=A0AA48HKF3_9FLAO|nr:hypothetical protein MACH07_27300 [Allomuricauda aquimarina]
MSNKQFTIIKRKNYQSLVNVILNIEKNLTWPQTYQSLFNKLFIVYCLLYTVLATAQIYPVQVTPQIIPPYSFQLSDYTTTTQEKLFVNLLLTDAQESGRQVRLKLFVEGPGINFQSTDFVSGTTPIILNGGINNRLTNLDLQAYFNYNNTVGISPQQYGQQLPEGQYRFCFEVYDQFSGQRISNRSCANVYLVLNDPPLLNVPFRGDLVTAQNPQNIIFNWTPRHINAGAVQYEFTLKELWDTGMDPQAAFLASPPLYQTTTYATTLHYGPAQMQLLEGKTYAWQVRAFVSDGINTRSLFRNNGMSEIYHFTYRADCPPPRFVLSEAENSQTVKINWQMGEHLRYRVQYRKKGFGENDWFGLWSQSTEAIIRNLEGGTVYEFRVGGDCEPLSASQHGGDEGLAYSPIHEFTTPTEDEMAYYNCGIPPEVEIANQDPLLNLGVNEVFTAGDFPITVKYVDYLGDDGRYTGWGTMTVTYFGDTNIRVEFENIKINTDYQLVEGMVETSYDPDWNNVVSVDDFNSDIGQFVGSLRDIISQIFDRRESELKQLEELQDQLSEGLITREDFKVQADEKVNNIEKLDDLFGEQIKKGILDSPVATEAQKEEVKKLGPTLLASSNDLSQTVIDYIIAKDAATRKRLEEIAEEVTLAEDTYFVEESFNKITNDPSFKGTLENLEKLIEYFRETQELCQEEGWASYKDQGIVPWCIWKEADIPQPLYHSKVDLPFVSGIIDGVYQEGEGLVELPKMLYQLGNGINDFIYAYTWAYLQCTPTKVQLTEERLGKLLTKLEAEKKEEGIWSWLKTQWYSVENYVANYKDKKCEDAAKLRSEIDELIAYVKEIENIKKLIEEVQQNLVEYWEEIEQQTNIARYEEGKIMVIVGSLFISAGALAATKIGRVKQILQKLHTFTKSQWDEFFEQANARLGRNLAEGVDEFLEGFVGVVRRGNPKEILEATTRIKNYRIVNNLKGKNCGYLEGNLNGNAVDNKIWLSGEAKPDVEPQIFTAIEVESSNGRSWLRNTDSEYKMLNKLASDLGGSPGIIKLNVKGELKIVSELEYCSSCQGVIQQFNEMFPNIKLILVDGAK